GRLNVRRNRQAMVEPGIRFPRAVRTGLSDEKVGLDERPDALLEEEGVALGPLDQELFERSKIAVASEKGLKELVSARRGQRVDPDLVIRHLAAPTVLVLGSIVDEKQQARGREALDEGVEERLRLVIDPMEI